MKRNLGVLLGLTAFTLALISSPLLAADRPIQISLVTPIQIFPEEDDIKGVRLNLLYGRNASITGLDIGFVNHTTSGVSKGWQMGFLGLSDSDFTGWQGNSLNIVKGDFKGLQLGVVNYAKFAEGVQIGLVNYVESMHGLQIGALNIIREGGLLPVFPIVNWSF